MPKVSIIIPTHNRAQLLRCAIASVLTQTCQDFEIIVVDDASTDNTSEVMKTFADVRIKYIRHEANKGDAGARNAGIRNSIGEFIAFLDDDDEWLPEKLEMQVDILTNSPAKVGGVYTGWLNIDKTTRKILAIKMADKRGDLFQELFVSNFIATPCILLRRECFERVGLFDERMPCSSDFDMWVRMTEHFELEYVNEPLVVVNRAEGAKLSTTLPLVLQGWEILMAKYRRCFAVNKKNYSRMLYSLGVLYCLNRNWAKSKEAFLEAIRLQPLAISYYRGLLFSLLGCEAMKSAIAIKETIMAPLRQRKFYRELQTLGTKSRLDSVRRMCQSGCLLPYV